MVDYRHDKLSIADQCKLLGLARSSYYYHCIPESEYNQTLMDLIDGQYTKTPFYGTRKMTHWLKRMDHQVNRKRIRRLMNLMGLEAVYPKPNLSKKAPNHRIYPYLLRDLEIDRPNQVWSIDITYIRLNQGFIYLVAIIDWYSRYVLSWEISNSLDTSFCICALESALRLGTPEIFNSHQGSQFTSVDFTQVLLEKNMKISLDGRGRALDNVFVERLWRSVKYEEVYLKNYISVKEAKDGLSNYFKFYNHERLHQSLDYKTPNEIYYGIEPSNMENNSGFYIYKNKKNSEGCEKDIDSPLLKDSSIYEELAPLPP